MIADLLWYFQDAHAALGMQSNLRATQNTLLSGGPNRSSLPDSMSERRMQAAERYRRIEQKLRSLPARTRTVLTAAYSQRNWSSSLSCTFGMLHIGVCAFCPTAVRHFEADSGKRAIDGTFYGWLEGVVARKEQERINEISVEATRILNAAHEAYNR
jgi:hypothetical protein